ncbi:glycoside hydrolase superfamily [Sparassis latifolia]
MHKLSNLLKHHSNSVVVQSQVSVPLCPPAVLPSQADFYRYRKQRGVNLGSWFVLERWITDMPFRFANGPAQSDLDVAQGSRAQEVLEHHWDTWITEQDWAWIAARGINTVRIPIGYYHICGADPSVLQGTDFANFEHVFRGAWARITNALATAHRYGIGVLFDLHAAPGKQNADSHSGTSSSNPSFFTNSYNMPHTTHILSTFLSHLTAFANSHAPPLSNLVGIELLNEPQPQSHNSALQKWYLDTFREMRTIDPGVPLYIGDAWMTDQYADFLGGAAVHFAVLDHHLYRCFTPGDASTPVSQHTHALRDPNEWAPQMFSRVSQKLEGAGCALVVAEWSGALNPGSLQCVDDENRAKREYVEAQIQLYDRYCAGWFFWTYKKEHRGDRGWSLRDAVDAGNFPSSVGLVARTSVIYDTDHSARRDAARDLALGEYLTTATCKGLI